MSRITESGHPFDHHEVDLLNASDEELRGIAEALGLGLSLEELRYVADHYVVRERRATDIELQTFDQTMSEHCSHKTFKGVIHTPEGTVDGLLRTYFMSLIDELKPDSETLFSEALQIARRRLRPEHPVTLRLVNALAVLHTKQKQYDEAETFFDEALKGRQRELGDDHPDTLESKNDLAVLYMKQALYDEAEPLLLESVNGRKQRLGEKHPHTLDSMNNLIELYEAWGKPQQAEQWRAKLPDAETAK
ncbi:tetratricopeptide repeat protein [Candidatus Bathyarchaeota archaeon]|nr:tetratricopeptide repeat protein [Candidatus Bathyarchaeota archaeon]